MIESIIPIIYMGGTGGHFLSAFLCYARDNNQNTFSFSDHGNAHSIEKDIGPVYGYDVSSQIIIDELLNQHVIGDKIRFRCAHITDTKLALAHFSKIIKITYDSTDCEMIANLFAYKWGVDVHHFSSEEFDKTLTRSIRIRHIVNRHFYAEDSPRVLNISFKSMLNADPDIFVEDLSRFTDIPKSQFNITNLIAWRDIAKKLLAPLDGVEPPSRRS